MPRYRACGDGMGALMQRALNRKGRGAVIHAARKGAVLVPLCGVRPGPGHLVLSINRASTDCPRCAEILREPAGHTR
jgi:hypothetical protein